MSDDQQTPGPWDYWLQPFEGIYRIRHEIDGNRLIVGHVAKEADARLVAAAPDSHQANKAFIAAIISEHNIPEGAVDDYLYDTIGSALAGAFFMARAAIAKAEGRS